MFGGDSPCVLVFFSSIRFLCDLDRTKGRSETLRARTSISGRGVWRHMETLRKDISSTQVILTKTKILGTVQTLMVMSPAKNVGSRNQKSLDVCTEVGHNVISGDVSHDGRGRDSHLRATGGPHWQIGLCKKPQLMFWRILRLLPVNHWQKES